MSCLLWIALDSLVGPLAGKAALSRREKIRHSVIEFAHR